MVEKLGNIGRKYSYDGMCEELALYFLHPRHVRYPKGASPQELAQRIQDAVEDFFKEHSLDEQPKKRYPFGAPE